MTRPRLPALPLDQADRRILGIGIILLLGFLFVCATVGAGVGIAVAAFRLLAGW